MTKVGEGKGPHEATQTQYQKDLDHNAAKFLNALASYQDANGEQKDQLKAIMDQSLSLVRAAVSEIHHRGIAKKEIDVEKDYQRYMTSQTPENLSALQEDLEILRDYNLAAKKSK